VLFYVFFVVYFVVFIDFVGVLDFFFRIVVVCAYFVAYVCDDGDSFKGVGFGLVLEDVGVVGSFLLCVLMVSEEEVDVVLWVFNRLSLIIYDCDVGGVVICVYNLV